MRALSDPLMPSSQATHHWTTTNVGEAAPGVLTPLCLALWGAPAERAARRAVHRLGILADDELAPPEDPADWILRPFYGRLAMQLEFMAELGDRVPGTTGAGAIRGMFGEAPATMVFHPTRERYAPIAWRFPRAFAGFPRALKQAAAEQDAWWRRSVRALVTADRAAALVAFAEAELRFERCSSLQLVGTISSVQPLYEAVEQLIARVGVGEIGILSGTGGAELTVIVDLWRVSRGELTLGEAVDRHGFHGPGEGELSSVVWREDATPLENLLASYRARPDAASPLAAEREREAEKHRQQQAILAAVPALQRPAVRALLGLAAQRIPLRGIAKRSFLQAIDIGRAAARRVGASLVEGGWLDDADDVFMLTADELRARPTAELRALVSQRRATRQTYQELEFVDTHWAGLPETRAVDRTVADRSETGGAAPTILRGAGVSRGVIEGAVRVVADPSFAEVEPGEVLVAATTDPSWSTIMFVSAALVVDIGGVLSHAAVVARELGIPCVVGTGRGTRALRTGDWVRVDGEAGSVEVLRPVSVQGIGL